MNQSVLAVWDTLRESAFGDITGAFTVVDSVFAHPVRLLVMQNLTDVRLLISDDGTNSRWTLPSGGQIVLDYASDASAVAGMWSMAVGAGIYVRSDGAAPTSGAFYVSAAYGKGE